MASKIMIVMNREVEEGNRKLNAPLDATTGEIEPLRNLKI